ncbi:MAG: CsgG/HfaB family protein [Candidatus Eisenbacteria bacterium]
MRDSIPGLIVPMIAVGCLPTAHTDMRPNQLLLRLLLLASATAMHPTLVRAAAPASALAHRVIAPAAPSSVASWQPALVVMPFTDRTEGAWLLWAGRDVGEGLARFIADSLLSTGQWRMPDTARVVQAFATRSRKVLLSDANALALGGSFGAELALTGIVSTFEVTETQPDPRYMRWGVGSGRRRTTATVVLELRLLDCATGSVVRTAGIKREQTSQSSSSAGSGDRVERAAFESTPLGRATREVVAATVQLLEEELVSRTNVRVARVFPNAVWLDAGRSRGLLPGQHLVVMRPEVVSMDPSDGTMIPQSEHIAAELVVTGFADGAGRQARCRLQRGRVEPGDVVRLAAAAGTRP